MIVFFDTSALLKLYFVGSGSKTVDSLWDTTELPCASVLLIPELLAAIARKRREGEPADQVKKLITEFESDWLSMVPVPLDRPVLARCAQLVQRHLARR